MKVNVTWNKQTFRGVEVDTDQPPEVFKVQLFSLTGVPVERQKVLYKGSKLPDDQWGKIKLKEGATLMMMGTAEEAPSAAPVAQTFIEDLPEAEQRVLDTKKYGSGLVNLGNTCYLNACLQAMYRIPELKAALQDRSAATRNELVAPVSQLFADMANGRSVAPILVVATLRRLVPQFQALGDGKGGAGEGRSYKQQDAEECWTAMLNMFRTAARHGGADPIGDLFNLELSSTLKCSETAESVTSTSDALNLKCNISMDVNHLLEGITLGLKADREQTSEELGRTALWTGDTRVTKLPGYLVVHVVRFYYKASLQLRAKIFRKVLFPLQLDLLDVCTDDLKSPLRRARDAQEARAQRATAAAAGASSAAAGSAPPATASTTGKDEAAGNEAAAMDVDEDAGAAAGSAEELTGRYNLASVVTHKGRSPDSGHYIAWVKQEDGSWVQFDDETMIPRKDEDIVDLCGGGDWHTGYIMVFRAETVADKPRSHKD